MRKGGYDGSEGSIEITFPKMTLGRLLGNTNTSLPKAFSPSSFHHLPLGNLLPISNNYSN
jgi:hypothetical protein